MTLPAVGRSGVLHNALAAQRARRNGNHATIGDTSYDGANGTNGANEPPIKRLALTCASAVRMEPVYWLCPGRIPMGKLTILDGVMGTGKTTLLCKITAAVTTGGPLPGQSATPEGDVIIISLEDGVADTIVPRLTAASADLSRCHVFEGYDNGGEHVAGTFNLDGDVERLRLAIEENDARLAWVDPFMAAIGQRLNSYKDQDMRSLLAPLAKVAEDTQCAIVLIRHPRKGGGTAEEAGGGSGGIGNACRSVLRTDRDPENPDRYLFSSVKSSLSQRPATLGYRLEQVTFPDHPDVTTSHIVWDGESEWTAEALAAQVSGSEEQPRANEAQEWLRDALSSGPRLAKELFRAGEAEGIPKRTLQRAADAIKVTKERKGFGEGSSWSLSSHSCHSRHSQTMTPMGANAETEELL
jgi:hypothetical protein